MKPMISSSMAALFALTLGFGMAYGAMGERCGDSNPPAEKCNAGKKSDWANHCGSAKCGEAKERFRKEHCGSGKAAESKPKSESRPKSDGKCGQGKCG